MLGFWMLNLLIDFLSELILQQINLNNQLDNKNSYEGFLPPKIDLLGELRDFTLG